MAKFQLVLLLVISLILHAYGDEILPSEAPPIEAPGVPSAAASVAPPVDASASSDAMDYYGKFETKLFSESFNILLLNFPDEDYYGCEYYYYEDDASSAPSVSGSSSDA